MDFKARRELIKESQEVYPLNHYGAFQMGSHRFYRLEEGKEDELTEVAKFSHLWKEEQGVWKIAKVISYDHQPAE